MNKVIDPVCFKNIVQGSYKQFRLKELYKRTKSATINEIVKLIQEEVKNANKKD